MQLRYYSHVAEGLRERKKQRTREQIIDAAMRRSPSAAITRRRSPTSPKQPNAAPRTFFSYFPSKEAVVFHHADRDMDSLATALRNRPAGQNALDGLRGWIDTMFDEWSAEEDQAVLRKRLCKEDDGLANFAGGMMARIHELLLRPLPRISASPRTRCTTARRRRGDGRAQLLDSGFDEKAERAHAGGEEGGTCRARRRDGLPARRYRRAAGPLASRPVRHLTGMRRSRAGSSPYGPHSHIPPDPVPGLGAQQSSQRALIALTELGHRVEVAVVDGAEAMEAAAAEHGPELIVCPMLKRRILESIWATRRCLHRPPGPGRRPRPSSSPIGR